jgi:predicted enzyme related to lactoylglutathione lyase
MVVRGETRPSLYCVELRTTSWEQSVRWYREALGLRVLVRVVEDGYALFEAGDTRLALIARDRLDPPSPRWSLGFEVHSLEEVARRLKEFGSEVAQPDRNPEGFRELVTNDPDGNSVRLFQWPEGAGG